MSGLIINQSLLNKARVDKFLLVLDLPKVLKSKESNTRTNELVSLDKLQFSVVGTFVPKVSVPAIPLMEYGQAYNVTSMTRPAYPPISINFNVDSNYDNYWVLWKWLSILNNPRKGGMDSHFAEFDSARPRSTDELRDLIKGKKNSVGYKHINMQNDYTDYQTTISIFGLREFNEQIIRFDYYNAFITGLGDLKYDYKDPKEMDCNFEFAFNQLDVTLLENNSDVKA